MTMGDGPAFGRMEQPIPATRPFQRAEELLAALGVGGSELPVDEYINGPERAFVTLPNVAAVAALRPNMAASREDSRARELYRGGGQK